MSQQGRALQIAVAIATLVPIGAGLAGMIGGASFIGWIDDTTLTGSMLDSHLRYLSGLLLAMGVAYLASLRNIEQHGTRFSVLTALVVTGGIARLSGLMAGGGVTRGIIFSLTMELAITPALWFWQRRIARRYRASSGGIQAPDRA